MRPSSSCKTCWRRCVELFPGQYIHIGGDEVPKDNWKKCPRCQARMKQEGLKNEHELQSYFIRRIEKFINAQGRNLIGWSEIREGGLAQNAVVMDWIGGAVEAASAGHDVIMSPTELLLPGLLPVHQPRHRAEGHRRLSAVEQGVFVRAAPGEAGPAVPVAHPRRAGQPVDGVYPQLQARAVHDVSRACARWPRSPGRPRPSRNWDDFTRRLQTQFQRFDQLGVNYRKGTPGSVRVRLERVRTRRLLAKPG